MSTNNPATLDGRWSRREVTPVWGPLRFLVGALVVVIAILGAVVSYILDRDAELAAQTGSAVNHTYDLISQISIVLHALQDAEINERDFVLTGNEAFLESYGQAERRLKAEIDALAKLIPEAERHSRRLERLSEMINSKIEDMERQIQERRAAADAAGTVFAPSGTGQLLARGIRQLVDNMIEEERRLLVIRLAADDAVAADNRQTTLIIVFSLLAITGAVSILLLRYVSSRHRAEIDLAQTGSLLRFTLENMAQGIAVFDQDLRLVAKNRRAQEMFDVPDSVFRVGASLRELIEFNARRGDYGAVDRERIIDERLALARQRIPYIYERQRPNGAVIEVRNQPMPDGTIVRTITDITERKLSEQRLRDSATRLKAILDNALDGIITINSTGIIDTFSPGAETIFGYRAEEVIGRNVNVLMPMPHRALHDGYIQAYVATGKRKVIGRRVEMDGLHKNGSRIPVELGISELFLGGNRMFIGVVRDISVQREIDRLKNEFVSTVSHELRTPLTSIAGALSLLSAGAAGALDARAERLITIAKSNSERLVRLINDILDIEKIASGRIEFHFQPLSVMRVVETAIEANRAYVESLNLGIGIDPDSVDCKASLDPDRMSQVLTNLISNAAKFSPPGEVVMLRVAPWNKMVRISVIDHGPGIPAEFHSRMFERFAQADASDSRRRGGTGLGLNIVKSIVEQHGGFVDYETAKGSGTTFHVMLPAWQEAPIPRPYADAASRGANILLCEDDPDMQAIVQQMLGNAGFTVRVAGLASDAEAALAKERFDAVLLDLALPDEDGVALIRRLRESPAYATLPIIVISGRADEARRRTGSDTLQVAEWLNKPVDDQRLLETVRQAVATAQKRPRVLHVEDDPDDAERVAEAIGSFAEVVSVSGLSAARKALEEGTFDLMILDVSLPDGSGLELLGTSGESDYVLPPTIVFSLRETSIDVSRSVAAALTKSRTSMDHLVQIVRGVTGQFAKAAMEG